MFGEVGPSEVQSSSCVVAFQRLWVYNRLYMLLFAWLGLRGAPAVVLQLRSCMRPGGNGYEQRCKTA